MLTVNTEVAVGDTIETACREAKQIAVHLGCRVRFGFNGIHVVVEENDDLALLVSTFFEKTRQYGFDSTLTIHAGYATGLCALGER